jgi:hypothetical protein
LTSAIELWLEPIDTLATSSKKDRAWIGYARLPDNRNDARAIRACSDEVIGWIFRIQT